MCGGDQGSLVRKLLNMKLTILPPPALVTDVVLTAKTSDILAFIEGSNYSVRKTID